MGDESRILMSLYCVPTKMSEWRKQLYRILTHKSEEYVANKLGISVAELHHKMTPDPIEDQKKYIEGVHKCIKENEGRFTREEVLKILGVDESEL